MHRVATIVVTYNSARTIDAAIRSLIEHGPAGMPIVVVDNASTDNSAALVEAFGDRVTLIRSPRNVGFGAGNNLGMRAVEARFYYLHNVDAYLNAGSLEQALAAMEADPTLGIAGLSLVYPDGRPQLSAYAFSSPLKWSLQLMRVQDLYRAAARGPLRPLVSALASRTSFGKSYAGIVGDQATGAPVAVDWVTGAALVLSRPALEKTGGFDEEIFLYSEDEDLCRRVRAAGFGIVRVRNEPFVHELGWHRNKGRTGYSQVKFASKQVFIRKHYRGWRYLAMTALLRLKRATNVD
jgi:N-acetylglucosaminyl-diphospho-decaprenol L-rhamnosyltransferase